MLLLTEISQRIESPTCSSFSARTSSGTVILLIRCLRTKRLGIGSGLKGTITNIYDIKKCRLEKKKSERSELEERERTHISAFAVSFLGLHAAINQPKGMLQSKVFVEKEKKAQLVNTLGARTEGRRVIMITHDMTGNVSETAWKK